jgi:TonB family protein
MRQLLILLMLSVGISTPLLAGQSPERPFSKAQIQDLVAAGADSNRAAKLIDERGINFTPTEDDLDALRKAGAQPVLIDALQKAAGSGAAPQNAGEMVLRVSASERAWVSVDADGKTALKRVLAPPESQTLTAKEYFDLTTDNAQALQLTLDGRTLSSLGRRWEIKSLHLTRESAKALEAAVPAAPPPPATPPPAAAPSEPAPQPTPATSPARETIGPIGPIHVDGAAQAAKLIYHPAPKYPYVARFSHLGGTVRLEALIAKDGTVQNLKPLAGPPPLVKAAMDAVRKWRYQPTYSNGQPVEVITEIELAFMASSK